MNAAVQAARAGAEVVLVYAAEQLGGQLHRQLPERFAARRPERIQHGWRSFRALRDEVLASPRIRHLPSSTVWSLEPDRRINIQSGPADAPDRRLTALRAEALVPATGRTTGSSRSPVGPARGGQRRGRAGDGEGPADRGRAAGAGGRNRAVPAAGGRVAGDDRVREVATSKVDAQWRPIPGTQSQFEVDAVCVGHASCSSWSWRWPRVAGSSTASSRSTRHSGRPRRECSQ